MRRDAIKFSKALDAAGLRFVACNSEGRVDWFPDALPSGLQQDQAAEIYAGIDWNAEDIDTDKLEMERLKALPRKDWQAADVKIAVQIWVSRE